jgi:hypothetical protein
VIALSWRGRFRRPVIALGPWAFKFARNADGRKCNLFEIELYRSSSADRQAMLCPALWCSPKGSLLIMGAAQPKRTPFELEDYLELCERWDYMPGVDKFSAPFEPNESNWGTYKGRLVALDYSTPAW